MVTIAQPRTRKYILASTVTTIIAITILSAVGYFSPSEDLSIRTSRKLSFVDEFNYNIREAKDDVGCISRKNKLIYVHIPKTGGSTIEGSELFDDAHKLAARGVRNPVKSHHPIWSMQQKIGTLGFETATTIRHPCERFISAFRYVTSPLANDGVLKQAKELVGGRKDIDEFVKYMDKNNWKPKKGNLLPHFSPLKGWLIDKHDSFGVDNILCQEQWNEGIERLVKKLGNKLSRTTRLDLETSLYKHKLQNSHATCADLKPETRAALERFYAMDYCLFGYGSLPTGDKGKCIGTKHNKVTMTLRYRDCQKKLSNQGIVY